MTIDAVWTIAALSTVTVKVAVLVALGALGSWTLRGASAATRHALWTAVLAGVFLVSSSPFYSSRWSISVALPASLSPVAGPLGVTDAPTPQPTGPTRALPEGPRATRSLAYGALILLWLGGVGMLATRFAIGRAALRGVVARARAVERVLPPAVSRGVRWIETDELAVPATWGTFRPVLALPVAARSWPAEHRIAALRHELAHVRRHDALTRALSDVACAVLWFHPGVWLVARRMRSESERACDDAVLRAGGSEVRYAELLLTLAGSASPRPAVHAMADARELELRLRAILDPSTARSSGRSVAVGAATGSLVIALVLGGTQLRASGTLDPDVPALLDEQVPMTESQERRALGRSFEPRDAQEAAAFARLAEASRHVKQHARDLVRERATWALSIADRDRVIAPLISALSDHDWRVRAYAATNLSLVDAPQAEDALVARLEDPVWRVRAAVAYALERMPDAAGEERMLALLDDPAWQVRLAAVEFFDRHTTPRGVEALRLRRGDAHGAVRSAAEAAISD